MLLICLTALLPPDSTQDIQYFSIQQEVQYLKKNISRHICQIGPHSNDLATQSRKKNNETIYRLILLDLLNNSNLHALISLHLPSDPHTKTYQMMKL